MRTPLSTTLTGPQRVAIAARAIVCERTVMRVLRGRATAQSIERVRRAAAELGIAIPIPIPQPPEASTHA